MLENVPAQQEWLQHGQGTSLAEEIGRPTGWSPM